MYARFSHLKVWENDLLSGRKDKLCCDCQVLPDPLSAASAPSVP